MKSALKMLGFPDDFLKYVLHQMVSFKKAGIEIKMSTREAQFVTLRELIEDVGVDVARFFFLTRSSGSHLVFDIDLAKTQSEENPAYYVQYAHARINSIIEFGLEKGFAFKDVENADFSNLNSYEEKKLIRKLSWFPVIIDISAKTLEPHHITNYLIELANSFHQFYQKHRVIQTDDKLRQSRLALCIATKYIIFNGLRILGLSAPAKM